MVDIPRHCLNFEERTLFVIFSLKVFGNLKVLITLFIPVVPLISVVYFFFFLFFFTYMRTQSLGDGNGRCPNLNKAATRRGNRFNILVKKVDNDGLGEKSINS